MTRNWLNLFKNEMFVKKHINSSRLVKRNPKLHREFAFMFLKLSFLKNKFKVKTPGKQSIKIQISLRELNQKFVQKQKSLTDV